MDENNGTNENQNFNVPQFNNMPNPNNDLGENNFNQAPVSPAQPGLDGGVTNPSFDGGVTNPVNPGFDGRLENPVQPSFDGGMSNPVNSNFDGGMSNPVGPSNDLGGVNPNINQTNVSQNNNSNPKVKKGSKKGLLIGIIVLLVIAIVVGVVLFLNLSSNPQKVVKGSLSNVFRGVENTVENKDFKTAKYYANLDVDLDLEQSSSFDKYIDVINDTTLSSAIQLDRESGKIVGQIGATYKNEDMLDLKYLADTSEERTFISLGDLYDKVIELDQEDSFYEAMRSLLTGSKTDNVDSEKINKVLSCIEDEVLNMVKSEYCSKEKVTIEVDGKNVNTTKNSLKMTSEEFIGALKQAFKNLANNEEFINCFDNSDEMKEMFENTSDVLEANTDVTFEYNIYTTGLSSNAVKIEFLINVEGTEGSFSITKINDNKLELVVLYQGTELVSGTIEETKNDDSTDTSKISLNIYQIGSITLEMKYSEKLNEAIDNFDTSDSISYQEISMEDYEEIGENLKNSKLYEFIDDLGLSNLSNYGSYGNYGGYSYSGGLDDDNTGSIGSSNTSNGDLAENEILTFNEKNKITFTIPNGFEIDDRYSSNHTVYLDKNDKSAITITTVTDNMDNSIDNFVESWSDRSGYSVSEPQELVSNGVKYKYVTLKYSSESIELTTIYLFGEIDDDSCLRIEIEDTENVTNDDLNELLKLKIEEYE